MVGGVSGVDSGAAAVVSDIGVSAVASCAPHTLTASKHITNRPAETPVVKFKRVLTIVLPRMEGLEKHPLRESRV